MNEITIKLTAQQVLSITLAVQNQMNNTRHMRQSCGACDKDTAYVEHLDNELKSLSEAYAIIRAAL